MRCGFILTFFDHRPPTNLLKPDLQCMYPFDLCFVAHYSCFNLSSSPFHSYFHLHRSGTIHQRWMVWWIISSASFHQLGLFGLFDTMGQHPQQRAPTSMFPSHHLLTTSPSHLFILSPHPSTHQTDIPQADTTRNNVCRRCCPCLA